MSEVIYVPLLEEGAQVWRPVHADHVSEDVYEITVEQEPKGERWAFPPRSVVRCRRQVFDDGASGLVAFELVNTGQ
jgi:hypothetical protein